MSVTVTLNIFSGRPNPRWFLSDAATAELRERTYRTPTLITAAPANLGGLGYRGFEIRFDDTSAPIHVYGGVVRPSIGGANLLDINRETERFLLGIG